MKTILLAAGALVIVGSSAGAGYYVMSGPLQADAPAAEPAFADPVTDPRYIDIDPLVIPVVADGRIRYHMFIRLSLEVDGKETANRVLARKIRLHHAFYMALYGGPVQAADGGGLDTGKIKAIVRHEAARVMGEGVIAAVTIRQAVPGRT